MVKHPAGLTGLHHEFSARDLKFKKIFQDIHFVFGLFLVGHDDDNECQ